MEIKLYTFSKRTNSTKRPSGGTQYIVRLKDDTELYSPTFLLNASLSELKAYNYATYDNLYYYVEGITSVGKDLTEISCRLDTPATLKSYIGNTQGFCVYGANGNYLKTDRRISLTPEKQTVATANGTLTGKLVDRNPCFLVNISDSLNGTSIYKMFGDGSVDTLSYFLKKVAEAYNDNDQQISGVYGNMYGAINSITAVPFTPSSGTAFNSIKLANKLFNNEQNSYYPYILPTDDTYARQEVASGNITMNLASIYGSYEFLAFSPYTSYVLFLPYYGAVTLNDAYLVTHPLTNAVSISATVSASFDVVSATLTWKVCPTTSSSGWGESTVGETYSSCVGVDIGFCQNVSTSARNMFSATKERLATATAIGSALVSPDRWLPSKLVSAIGSIATTEMNIKSYNWGGELHQITHGGETGGGLMYDKLNDTKLCIQAISNVRITSDLLDKDVIGAPVGKMGKVSDFGGFVQMNGASVSAPFPSTYISEANSLIASGIYYE